ncbi:MAG: aspartate aminotransferase family protein [Pseudomonadales bacterium]|jgi:putrescine aminotransferase|uniref:aspartate aminotransferase family protein n=1 Tax=Halopseudomonas TaxID=2901189 RepID=UPI000C50D540|nr:MULTISPECIES: aspartate aminotransferase family protein [Halopseudomonas]MAH00495.1 aspartate aminotransferase family protein [Pseudomonadales bacterium]MEE2798682.1 aspartate aminotransferase family protein [Pseudomonadota bacterium]HBT55638.1 aspartate aminotransferase family protein [Pseudomonas sp.]MAK73789.1 aspartate aminotransferase family protein [Pseudomonadales bacterium]MAP77050.1 aspartate aminotransferase family protein [Pseudomonadales bacterium]|tara:strand:+ start:1979 stop:3343 length:1365 start_codon:yes stop_codon:yes gene_type:complete
MSKLNTAELQAMDAAHYLHPFTDHKELGERGTRIIERAEGVYLWDSEGNKVLDGMAGLWCVNIGYGRKELAEAAYQQMLKLPYYNSFFQCANPPAIELATAIAEVAPEHMNHVFFTGSGSESNDTVLRMVRRYWDLKGKPTKKTIISRINGYHGSTVAGASLGGMSVMHEQGDLPIPGIVHIPQPYWYGEGGDMSPDEFGIWAAQQLEAKILELGIDQVAAFIAEPIQGAGGVIIPPDTYWPEIKRILAKYEILLVIDEVICGFGRTGQWFASQHYDLQPDLMPIAKGMTSGYLPMGGVIVSDRVAETMIEHGGEFYHGYTYSGHPASAAVGLENLRIMRDEKIVDYVRNEAAPYLQDKIAGLAAHRLVGEVRGVGLLGAIELVKDKATRERFPDKGTVGTLCRDLCVANGLVMRAVGDTMIMSPPLIISRAEIDELVDKAWKVLDLVAEQLGV